SFSLIIPPPPRSTPFPYTTLFRSPRCRAAAALDQARRRHFALARADHRRGRRRDPSKLHELLHRQCRGRGPAIWRTQRQGCRADAPGALPRSRCNRSARRPHPHRGRKLPLHLATGSRMTKLTVAALQLAFTDDTVANIRAVSDLAHEAASKGAEVVLPPELFEGPYFCRVEDESLFANARAVHEHPCVLAMKE